MLQNLMLDDVEHPYMLEVELLQFLDVELLQLLTVELFQQLDDVELLQLQLLNVELLQLLDVELPQLLEVVLCLVSGGLSGIPIRFNLLSETGESPSQPELLILAMINTFILLLSLHLFLFSIQPHL